MTPEDVYKKFSITDDQAISLRISLIGRLRSEDLRTRRIKDALDRGVLLRFNPIIGTLEESLLHQTLQQTFEDIQSLRRLNTAAGVEKL